VDVLQMSFLISSHRFRSAKVRIWKELFVLNIGAERVVNVQLSSIRAVLDKAKALEAQGKNVIHLGIGEPDFDTPSHI
jgi:hypothetical protein